MAKKGTEIIRPATVAVDRFSEGVHQYLDHLGLPSEGVLVTAEERFRVFQSLPDLVDLIDSSQRQESMYVSKFIAACGAGLFDAALNFIWDEVVQRLRARVARFDLAYFFDTAVTNAADRADYSTEEDLRSLSDAALIQGALKCGMITDLAYKHLDYIRDMRNWASAAHPNHAQLTGFQLVAWFETCVKEVILREPAGEVLEVGRLLRNIREQKLTASDVPAIATSVRRLPPDLASALLRSVVGHYADPRQDVRVRDNVRLVAPAVWENAPESARGEVGIKHWNFAANGDVDRKKLVHEFLDVVGGLPYLADGERADAISTLINRLALAHQGWDNWANEPPIARELRKYIGDNGLIPATINEEYVRILTWCRVGRVGRAGPAPNGVPIYDELISLFGEPQLRAFVGVLWRTEITSRLYDAGCATRFHAIVDRLLPKIVDQPLRRIYEIMRAATGHQLQVLSNDSRFIKAVQAL